jgi:hypothetical protein
MPAAFTDHHVVILSIETGQKTIWRNRKQWKINPMMISEESFKTSLSNKWKEWKQAKENYPEVTIWCERHVKHRLQIFSRQHEARKRSDMK